jgi:hypothetical protein
MIVTKEMDKLFRPRGRAVPAKSLALVRKVLGINKFKQIVGKEITQDIYDELMRLKDESLSNKRAKVKSKREINATLKPKLIKASNIDTASFIKNFIENESESNIHGGLVPEWIHAPVSWDIIRIRLMQLDYKNFLKTYYWKAIRLYMIHKTGDHCTYCHNEKNLNVHHKSYDHHGVELFFIDDLIVLCESCHAKEHGIKMVNTTIHHRA